MRRQIRIKPATYLWLHDDIKRKLFWMSVDGDESESDKYEQLKLTKELLDSRNFVALVRNWTRQFLPGYNADVTWILLEKMHKDTRFWYWKLKLISRCRVKITRKLNTIFWVITFRYAFSRTWMQIARNMYIVTDGCGLKHFSRRRKKDKN